MSTGLLIFWGALALIALLGVTEIIRKARRGPRALSRHRPDARDTANRPALGDHPTAAIGQQDALAEQRAEAARNRRAPDARARADAKAERARRLRPWDHH